MEESTLFTMGVCSFFLKFCQIRVSDEKFDSEAQILEMSMILVQETIFKNIDEQGKHEVAWKVVNSKGHPSQTKKNPQATIGLRLVYFGKVALFLVRINFENEIELSKNN